MAQADVLNELIWERNRQHERWTEEHDDGHSWDDWLRIIDKYVGTASDPVSEADFQYRMAVVGALAVAALESRHRIARRRMQDPNNEDNNNLLAAVEWVLTDMGFSAPELHAQKSELWFERLAIATGHPEKYGIRDEDDESDLEVLQTGVDDNIQTDRDFEVQGDGLEKMSAEIVIEWCGQCNMPAWWTFHIDLLKSQYANDQTACARHADQVYYRGIEGLKDVFPHGGTFKVRQRFVDSESGIRQQLAVIGEM